MSATHTLKRLYSEETRMIRIAGSVAMCGVAVGHSRSSNTRYGRHDSG
jgi:hypothetical protein